MPSGWQFSCNNTPTTGSQAMYLLITEMIAAGWTKVQDSDGTTYSASGTQVTGGGSGAHGLGNNSAYVVMQDPSGLRQYCAQRGTTDLLWRWTYSKSAKFLTGSPSATQVPSASDGQILNGAGTDASPTFATMFGTNGAYRYSCGAQATPNVVQPGGTGAPINCYPFFAVGWTITAGANSQTHGLFSDAMDPVSSAPFNASDTDPMIHYFASSSSSIFGSDIASGGAGHPYGYINGIWQSVTCAQPQNVNAMGTDPLNGKDAALEILLQGNTAPLWFKGYPANFFWAMTGAGAIRTTGQAFSLVTTNDHIYINQCILPWNGSSPTL